MTVHAPGKITPPVGFDKPIGWVEAFLQWKDKGWNNHSLEQEVVTKIFDGTHFVDYDSAEGLAVRNLVLMMVYRLYEHPAVSVPPLWTPPPVGT